MSSRVRRKSSARTRLNYELVGIAAIGLAILLGIALILPSSRSGFIGAHTAWGLRALFGAAAGYFPLLVALFASIVFLEINVPRMIAVLGGAALGYFLIVCAAYGPLGGLLGLSMWNGLRFLLGEVGATIVLIVAALALTVWVTNVSVKRVIGWTILTFAALRAKLRASRPAQPKNQLPAPAGPATLREAFHLPEPEPELAGTREADRSVRHRSFRSRPTRWSSRFRRRHRRRSSRS